MQYKKLITLLIFSSLFSILSCSLSQELPEKGICAHRGANKTHPENTIPAFKEAIRLGAQMIEFDVRQTKDGQLVILHDATLDRTTNGTGPVTERTFEYIKSLDAGSWKSADFAGTSVPTFKETLKIMPRNIWLNIHIKGNPEIGAQIAKIVSDESRLHQSVLACSYQIAQAAFKVNPDILICNMDRKDTPTQYVQDTIEKKYHFLQFLTRSDADLVNLVPLLKENNIKVNYYSCNSTGKMKSLLNAGVDFILTDNLEELLYSFNTY